MVDLIDVLPVSQKAILWLIWRASQLTTCTLKIDDVVQALSQSSVTQLLFPTSHKPLTALTQSVIIATTFLRQPQANCLNRDMTGLMLTDVGQKTATQIKPESKWEEVAQKISSCAQARQKFTVKPDKAKEH